MKGSINSVNKELHEIKAMVTTDTISISGLFKLSFRLIKIRLKELLVLWFSASLVSSAESLFFQMNRQISDIPSGFTVLQDIISVLLNSFLYMLLLSAIMSVYDAGRFFLTNVLKKAISVYLKYLWTYLIFVMLSCVGFLILSFLVGFVLMLIRIPSKSILLLSAVLLSPVVIWFFARAYFVSYIVVYHNRYGPSAIARSFALTKGYGWRLIRYLIPIALLTSPILVPIVFAIRGDIILSSLVSIPISMITLLTITYGFILYENFVRRAL